MKSIKLFKIRFWLLVLVCPMTHTATAQQEVMYSQYMFNTLAINPSYAGSRDVLSVTAVGRQQWINVPGAPVTYSFSIDTPFRNEKMGLGLAAYNDANGVYNNTGVNLAYAYKLRVSEKATLSLGLQPTLSNISYNIASLLNHDVTDPNAVNVSKMIFNAGGGLFLSNDKRYIGFSVPQIIEQKLGSTDIVTTKRHYFLMAGLVFGKGNVKYKPSTMIRYTKGAGMGLDLNMNFWFRDKIAYGISARKSQSIYGGLGTTDAIVNMLELQLTPQIRVGYAYDYTTSALNTKFGTGILKGFGNLPTHEFMLRYEFGYGKSKILTPRYF